MELYTIGTSDGILRQHTRAQFISTIGAFLEETEFPENKISLCKVTQK